MLKQSLSQKLLQKLSPQQIQFIKLLELNTLNFEQKVEEELIENPALENNKDEASSDEYDNAEDYNEGDTYESSTEDSIDVSDYLSDDDGGIRLNDQYGGDDEEKDFIPINASVSFRDRLLESVKQNLQTEHEYILADQIIGTIEDDGYLRRP
ncbi:MAG: RNA polymerase sigma-54 factor, partial [bacterium]